MYRSIVVILTLMFVTAASLHYSWAQQAELLKCAGSRTATYIVSPLAKEFKKADVIVIGGHTGDGFRRLFENQTDIVMASRKAKDKEKEKAKTLGIELVENKIGYSPIMIAINPENQVDSLTIDQIKGIFTGKIKNWDAVGGKAAAIEVFALDDPSSGTVAIFKNKALGGGDFTDQSIRVSRLTTALKALAKRPNAIAFCRPGDMNYHNEQNYGDVKIIGLSLSQDGAVYTPDENYGVTGDYPLNRAIYLYYDKKDDNPLVKEFCQFCVSNAN